ncbi:MAG: type IV secretion system DNA-binding domain-containing protein [Bacillota bacterium]|nr:type IV secretion system DNA-binding domain-containing protein [Bacillota bacterium]MDP2196345.1 type IV secretion system DNA-binding domain-containing protein [Rhodocyclaceae bacterium]
MISKSWWSNWGFRVRVVLVSSIFSASAAAVIPAAKFHEESRGWFGSWLYSIMAVKAGLGEVGKVEKLNLPPARFLESLCNSSPKSCDLYHENSKKYFVTYPSIAAGVVWLIFFSLIPIARIRKKSDETHRRGMEVVAARDLAKMLKKEPADIYLGGVPWPRALETRSLLMAGSPGSGKTVAINTILQAIRKRGDRAIVVDAGGGFAERFARQGDTLINPFDRRSAAWSPFADCDPAKPWEIEAMARGLVPAEEGGGSSKIFADLAKTVLAGLIEQCHAKGIATNHALASLATCGNSAMLAAVLKGHPAHALVASGSPQTVGSILTNLTERGAGLRYLPPDAGANGFSISNWVTKGDGDGGWLFLSFQLAQREALKVLIAAQLDIVARSVLGLPEAHGRRIWLIVDELPLLGKVDSMVEFLTNGRKYGGCAMVGIQGVPQLRERYGRDGSQTMLSCLGSQLVLRASDAETADLMSKMLGEHEIQRVTHSTGKSDGGRSQNSQEQIATTRAVMASELQNLPDLAGYLNVVGDHPTARIKLEIPNVPAGVNPPFLPAEIPARRPFVLPAHLLLADEENPAAEAPAPAADEPKQPVDWRSKLKTQES